MILPSAPSLARSRPGCYPPGNGESSQASTTTKATSAADGSSAGPPGRRPVTGEAAIRLSDRQGRKRLRIVVDEVPQLEFLNERGVVYRLPPEV